MMTTREIRKQIAEQFNLAPEDVRCYHCKRWGYNRGNFMTDTGCARCALSQGVNRENLTASYQFCRGFDYVGNGGK